MRLTPTSICLLATYFMGTVSSQADVPCLRPPCQTFTQKLNHDKPNDNTTFSQRYQIDTSHFQPGGPILFHQNEEAAITSNPFPEHVFNDYAPKLGAMVVCLEHRYFGNSYPEGFSAASNITAAQYAPLTLDNVFGDSIVFLQWLKSTIPGAQSSPIIYGAGSYGGFLAIMARVRYSDVFAGALAFNPICRSWGASTTVEDNPYKFAAADKVAEIYWDANADAARKIKAAVAQLDTCIRADNCDTELPDLNLCTQPAGIEDWTTLLHNIIIEQYFDIPQFEVAGLNFTALINATLAPETPAQVLRVPIDAAPAANNPTHTGCVAWGKLAGEEATAADLGIGTSWLYMTCNWMIFSDGAISPSNSLFPEWAADVPYPGCDTELHADWVGQDMNKTNAELEAKYNITDEELDKVTNLLIINGSRDRTAALCSPKLTLSTDRSHSRVVEVWDMAHGDSSFSETLIPRGFHPQVDAIRDTQLAYIQEWLNLSVANVTGMILSNGTSAVGNGNAAGVTSFAISMGQQDYGLVCVVASLLASLAILASK